MLLQTVPFLVTGVLKDIPVDAVREARASEQKQL